MNVMIKCKDCGDQFEITKKHTDWFKEKGFELPKRCPACRAKRKEAKNDNA